MNKENIVYGIHAIEEALDSGKELNKLIVAKGIKHASIDALMKRARQAGVAIQLIPKESSVFPSQRNHQGVVAHISPIEYHSLENVLPSLFEKGETPFILVLDHITDVRNFGAIARSAVCMGVHALVVPQSGSAPVSDDAIKTSAGALMTIPVCRERNLKTSIEFLNQSGVTTIGMSEKANKELPYADLSGPVALVMGSEEKGLSEDVLRRCTLLTKIPMASNFDSLNVSVAAGIAMYEVVRQKIQD